MVFGNQVYIKGKHKWSIRIDEFTGKPFTFFQDPDGLPLELYQV